MNEAQIISNYNAAREQLQSECEAALISLIKEKHLEGEVIRNKDNKHGELIIRTSGDDINLWFRFTRTPHSLIISPVHFDTPIEDQFTPVKKGE